VDLPEPPVPLPEPLRWTSMVIATATLVLTLGNASALRGWSYTLPPSDWTAGIVSATEGWYIAVDHVGLNRPAAAMHARWQALKDRRFAPQAPAPSESLSARQYSSSASG
jgi:hypothetical protein